MVALTLKVKYKDPTEAFQGPKTPRLAVPIWSAAAERSGDAALRQQERADTGATQSAPAPFQIWSAAAERSGDAALRQQEPADTGATQSGGRAQRRRRFL